MEFCLGPAVEYLKRELARRVALNSAYSLGAFARSLRYDKAALSRILSGQRPMSPKTMKRLGRYLDFQTPEASGEDFERLSDDVFATIQGFEHFAILELMQTKNFRSQIPWIARSLGITTIKARLATDRLLRLGIINKTSTGDFVEVGSGWTTSIHKDRTDLGRKALQRELLQKAMLSLETQALEIRDHSSLTFAISHHQIEQAKTLIAKFRRQLARQLASTHHAKDCVYNLSIALFPLTIKPE